MKQDVLEAIRSEVKARLAELKEELKEELAKMLIELVEQERKQTMLISRKKAPSDNLIRLNESQSRLRQDRIQTIGGEHQGRIL